MIPIEEGLDFILNHFQEPVWPRTISTRTTECRQIPVNNIEEALARFKQSNYLDCRVSAYGTNADENPSTVARFLGIKTATPSDIIVMIDLDRCNFKSERALSSALSAILKNIKNKLSVNAPTVLYSGRGYHIIQPLDANGIILESIKEFENIQQVSLKFLRFVEWFLSNGKFLSNGMSDSRHNNTVSFGNMMLRIPGSINSKNGQVVRVIQKWDSNRPKINYLLRDFRHWLIDQILIQEHEQQRRRYHKSSKFEGPNNNSSIIRWIEKLLETPIADYRKLAIWHILAPYLINKRRLSYDEAYSIIRGWLTKCDILEKLDFNPDQRVKVAIRGAHHFFPISHESLKVENEKFYHLLKNIGVLTS